MQAGTIKFYDSVRGYGFVTTNAGDDYFFHAKDCGDWRPAPADRGAPVLFTVGPGKRNEHEQAYDVRPAGDSIIVDTLRVEPGPGFDLSDWGYGFVTMPTAAIAVIAPDAVLTAPAPVVAAGHLVAWLITLGGRVSENVRWDE